MYLVLILLAIWAIAVHFSAKEVRKMLKNKGEF